MAIRMWVIGDDYEVIACGAPLPEWVGITDKRTAEEPDNEAPGVSP